MNKIEDIINSMPKMKTGEELKLAMTNLPEYNPDIINKNEAHRLIALSNLYDIYIPSQMSLEIYNKLYLALLRSLQKKSMRKIVIQQQSQNYKAINKIEFNSVIGGSDSFTIIGVSGIGKSTAINNAISLITENHIIEVDDPYTKIIPCIVVQCPFDSSVKGFLLEILRKVDEHLESNYYEKSLRTRATIDALIGAVSQVALNHIGMLIVDEIQNVVNSKNGKSLVGMLTQLINNSGISICMVGTPESTVFFEQAMQLARRSLGLSYNALEYDNYFKEMCEVLLSYQYVKNDINPTESIINWLYQHSSGIISIVISLIHDAQEIAILTGKEFLNIETLNEAYQNRLSLLHNYIQPTIKQNKSKPKKKINNIKIENHKKFQTDDNCNITELVAISKNENIDIVQLLKKNVIVIEVKI